MESRVADGRHNVAAAAVHAALPEDHMTPKML